MRAETIGGPGSRKARTGASLLTIFAALLAVVALAFGSGASAAAPPGVSTLTCAPSGFYVGFLGFSDALNKETYEGTTVGGLSALAYDKRRNAYYSLVDNDPDADSPARFYTLDVPLSRYGLGEPEILDVTTLEGADGRPFTASDFDGEGLTLARNGELLISSETEPSIYRFTLDGELLEELPVPQKFLVAPEGEGRSNQTFESLSLSPNGRSLFTANEGYLLADGETADGSDRIRILRYEDRGPGGFEPAEEFFNLAKPGQGVVEIVALSENELLVLERDFVSGEGNTVRIFQVSLREAEDVSDEPRLVATDAEPAEKELLVDLADCPPGGAKSPGTQENPLLDNYESLELGPRQPGGRRAVLLQSDDNFNDVQVTRLVALGTRLNPGHAGQ